MDVIHAYIYLAILGMLAIGFPAMSIYAVVLYFRGRKIPKNPCEKAEAWTFVEEEQDDITLDPAHSSLSCNIFHDDRRY